MATNSRSKEAPGPHVKPGPRPLNGTGIQRYVFGLEPEQKGFVAELARRGGIPESKVMRGLIRLATRMDEQKLIDAAAEEDDL